MELQFFHRILANATARGYALNDRQRAAVDYQTGPLWLLAGPGSGKSEVLVTRTLRLLCVDKVDARTILVTTFTKKASRNLEDRLATYLMALQAADPDLQTVDLADLRVGTIHSLANDILHEFRDPNYQNVRLLDDVEQHLFAYRYSEIANCQDISFWADFEYAFPSYPRWLPTSGFPPNKWQRVKVAMVLFNHIVEDLVNLALMRAQGGNWARLADFYAQYEQALRQNYRCDFAHVQRRFLDFLTAPAGQRFLSGDEQNRPPLLHVLVDEYQDTNPIQERIYLALAQRPPHNLTVVGDDDQALYRFRGGTVACMVNFNQACQAAYGIDPMAIQLIANYRSHRGIVDYFNDYITSFDLMNEPGVRAPGKQAVDAQSNKTGNYPPIGWLSRPKAGDLGDAVADFIQNYLINDQVIEDYSQCVILMRSTRDSPRNAGPFIDALRARGIPVYNPRSKSFMESQEVQCLLGALVEIVDPNFQFTALQQSETRDGVQSWVNALLAASRDPSLSINELRDYILRSNDRLRSQCRTNPGQFLNVNLLEIIYRIISLEPFRTWRTDPERNYRLSKLTRLFESYHSLRMDTLLADDSGSGIAANFLNRFYYMFVSYLINSGIDDDEDEDVIVPRGRLPLMTIHQSKGLEFPFVIVAQLGQNGDVGASQILEQALAPFREQLYRRRGSAPDDMAAEDDIRLWYVAYSRAEYGLIFVAAPTQINKRNETKRSLPSGDFTEFRRRIPLIQ